jgi:hypothetical protein
VGADGADAEPGAAAIIGRRQPGHGGFNICIGGAGYTAGWFQAHVENTQRELQVHSWAQIAAWVTEHQLRPGALGSSPDVPR